jgi:hypothetical protein
MIGLPINPDLSDPVAHRSSGPLKFLARHRFGFFYVLSIPIVAILADTPGIDIAGFHITGWMWLSYAFVGIFLLLFEKAVHQADRFAFPIVPWSIWYGYVWLSLIWTQQLGRGQIQQATQVSMPLLVGVIASVFVRTKKQLDLLFRTYCYALLPGIVILLLAKSHNLPLNDMNNPDDPLGTMAPFGMMVALIGSIYLVRFWHRLPLALLGWGIGLFLTFASGARTVTATMILLPMLNPAIKKMRTRVFMAVAVSTLGLGLFYTPWFQHRFFYTGAGSLSDIFGGEFDTSGRFDAWPWYWDEAWKHPVFGSGVGSVATISKFAWGDGDTVQVHNDYLAIFFEFGLLGLAIFVSVFTWQMAALWRGMRRSEGVLRDAFAVGVMGLIVLALNACTDNPLGYNLWFMDPLFVLIGAAYGVQSATAARKQELGAIAIPPALLQTSREFSMR